MAIKKAASKKTVSKSASTKKSVLSKVAPAIKASTKNVPQRKTAPEKKAFVKAKANVKTVAAKPLAAAANSTASHIISYAEGKEMIGAFMGKLNDLSAVAFNTGMQFDISLFQKLVALPEGASIRIYNAIKGVPNESTGEPYMQHTFVITAVDKNDNILFLQNPNNPSVAGKSANGTGGADDGVGNMGTGCPAY